VRVGVEELDEIAALAGDLLVDGARARGRTRELQELLSRWSRLGDQALAAADELRHRGDGRRADRMARDVHLLRTDAFRFLRRHADAVGAVEGQFALLADRVSQARLVPLSTLLAGLPRAARDLAQEQGKEVTCAIEGADLGVDRAILLALGDPLVHLLRNAVDHGLEPPAERVRAGKPPAGRIAIAARLEGEQLALTVEDDGRGLDAAAIRAAALRLGVATEERLRVLDGPALHDLLFLPGFTTRAEPGEVSGRGVGLEVVRRRVTEVGGSAVVEAVPGGGARFVLRMPQSLALLEVLLVRVEEDVYAVPASDVESVGRIDPVDLTEVAGLRALRQGERLVPVAALGPLLSLGPWPRARRPAAAFLRHGPDRAAVVVDGLAGEREVAVKSPGPFLAGAPFLTGAAVLPDGRAALLLSTPALVAAARRQAGPVPAAPERRRLRVLLVDDSAIARDAEAALLRGLGHEVEEAVDGEDAWRRLAAGAFQALLTDVQMPLLDGIDLARRVRGSARHARLPVVILSSLSAPEERRRGLDAGADAYLVKGELSAEALGATLERLCGGGR
jgi:two-component system chemotaxis sensor kinase CheA/two-component system sensor histidine kinase and response regulator WspE